MSASQTIWLIFWDRAARDPEPFELSEVLPEIARQRGVKPEQASKSAGLLLKELERLPEGGPFFRRAGDAVVPLPEFQAAVTDRRAALEVYPFEL